MARGGVRGLLPRTIPCTPSRRSDGREAGLEPRRGWLPCSADAIAEPLADRGAVVVGGGRTAVHRAGVVRQRHGGTRPAAGFTTSIGYDQAKDPAPPPPARSTPPPGASGVVARACGRPPGALGGHGQHGGRRAQPDRAPNDEANGPWSTVGSAEPWPCAVAVSRTPWAPAAHRHDLDAVRPHRELNALECRIGRRFWRLGHQYLTEPSTVAVMRRPTPVQHSQRSGQRNLAVSVAPTVQARSPPRKNRRLRPYHSCPQQVARLSTPRPHQDQDPRTQRQQERRAACQERRRRTAARFRQMLRLRLHIRVRGGLRGRP